MTLRANYTAEALGQFIAVSLNIWTLILYGAYLLNAHNKPVPRRPGRSISNDEEEENKDEFINKINKKISQVKITPFFIFLLYK